MAESEARCTWNIQSPRGSRDDLFPSPCLSMAASLGKNGRPLRVMARPRNRPAVDAEIGGERRHVFLGPLPGARRRLENDGQRSNNADRPSAPAHGIRAAQSSHCGASGPCLSVKIDLEGGVWARRGRMLGRCRRCLRKLAGFPQQPPHVGGCWRSHACRGQREPQRAAEDPASDRDRSQGLSGRAENTSLKCCAGTRIPAWFLTWRNDPASSLFHPFFFSSRVSTRYRKTDQRYDPL